MAENDGFAMEEIRERHSNSFSSHKSSPDGLRRAQHNNNTGPDNGGAMSTSIDMMAKRENSADVIYTWSGLTIKTKQERKSIKDSLQVEQPEVPTRSVLTIGFKL